MSSSPPETVTEWLEDPPPRPPAPRRARPEDYVLRRPWLNPVVTAVSVLVLGVSLGLATVSPLMALVGALLGASVGIVMTLVAMAWGTAIVYADDARRGLWFTLFPPYMAVYALQRWSWMSQPTVLFFAGLMVAFGALYGAPRISERQMHAPVEPGSLTLPAPPESAR